MKLFVATHNQHKIREISQILPGFEIVPDDPEGVEENAPDFAGNALIKVHAIAERHRGEWCMADDSGLEVKALGGAPGVHSARYAGEPTNTPANNALLLKNLEGVGDRRARFTCCCALVDPSGEEMVVHGHCPGRIAEKAAGVEGFGYDPLFIPDGYDKSFAELSADEKNAISHRGRALEKVREIVGNGEPGMGNGEPPPPRLWRSSRGTGGESSTPPLTHSSTFLAWLRLFRVVNLPTVPGDVLVGAATMLCWSAGREISSRNALVVGAASVASVLLYMFGLADNDIVGAKTDRDRPIPDGEISLGAARVLRGLCLFAAMIVAAAANLQSDWWVTAFLLVLAVVVYNRTKWSLTMGLCRGLNVLCGAVAVGMCGVALAALALVAPLIWTLYIALVSWYSKGEEGDPGKKRRVGLLVGGIVYLQLTALILLALRGAQVMPLLVAGAVLLVVQRLFRQCFPNVSAS